MTRDRSRPTLHADHDLAASSSLIVVLIALGVAWYGLSLEVHHRFWPTSSIGLAGR